MCRTRLAEIQNTKIRHLRTIARFCRAIFSQLSIYRQSEKNWFNPNISSTRHHITVNFGPLTAGIGWRVWAPQQISTGFASWLRCCTNVAQRRSAKLRTMFGGLLAQVLGRYTACHTGTTNFQGLYLRKISWQRQKIMLCKVLSKLLSTTCIAFTV